MNTGKYFIFLGIVAALICGAGAGGSAAGFESGKSPALTELIAVSPGGAEAFNAMKICDPKAVAVPLGRATAIVSAAQAGSTDDFIKALAVSAERQGKTSAARLLHKLLADGTPEEKAQFANWSGNSYAFPARFYPTVYASGVCTVVTELFCKLSCIHTGTAQESCKEECRNIIVKSCN